MSNAFDLDSLGGRESGAESIFVFADKWDREVQAARLGLHIEMQQPCMTGADLQVVGVSLGVDGHVASGNSRKDNSSIHTVCREMETRNAYL